MTIKEYTEDLQLKKDLLPIPGEFIQEIIDFKKISQKELADKIGKTPANMNEIIKGKTIITEDTALKLEYALGSPASFWLSLERKYQDRKLEIKKIEGLLSSLCSAQNKL
jgi:addiction module HigA family antidote